MQCVRKVGRKPYYRLRVGGKEYNLGTDRLEAHRRASLLLKDAEAPDSVPTTVAGLIVRWLELNPNKFVEDMLKPWAKFAGMELLEDLSRNHLENYTRHLLTRKAEQGKGRRRRLSAWSIQKFVRYARKMLLWAVEQEWAVYCPPLPHLPTPVKQPRDVPPQLLERAFSSLGCHAGRILRFILATGARPGEACSLRWEHVDFEREVCELPAHKTAHYGRTRTIYLTPDATEILMQIRKDRGPVFLSNLESPYTVDGLRSILRRRGINRTYALRHTFAQHALEQGVPLEDVAKLLGHTGLGVVQTYAQVRDPRARKVASSLTSPLRGLPRIDEHSKTTSGEASAEPNPTPTPPPSTESSATKTPKRKRA